MSQQIFSNSQKRYPIPLLETDEIQIGGTDFTLQNVSGKDYLTFEGTDNSISYTKSVNIMEFNTNGVVELAIDSGKCTVANLLRSPAIVVDDIDEQTPSSGVTIEGSTFKSTWNESLTDTYSNGTDTSGSTNVKVQRQGNLTIINLTGFSVTAPASGNNYTFGTNISSDLRPPISTFYPIFYSIGGVSYTGRILVNTTGVIEIQPVPGNATFPTGTDIFFGSTSVSYVN